MKQKHILAALLATVLLFTAGCGGTGDPPSPFPSSTPDGGTSQGEPQDAAPTVSTLALSDPDYNFDAEYFYSDYNSMSNADVDRQGGIDTFINKDIVFQSLNWQELVYLLEQEGNYLILLGGSWCHNTRAVISYVNDYAHEYGINTIYNFDFRLDGATADTHIRVTNSNEEDKLPGEAFNYLYGELVTRYLTNLTDWVEYTEDSDSAVTYTNAAGEDVTEAKVQVPFLFLYNKDNTIDNSGNNGTAGSYPIVYGFEEMVDRDPQGIYVTEAGSTERTYITDEYLSRLRATFDYIKDNGIELSDYTDADYIRLSFNEERYGAIEGVEYRRGNPIFPKNDQINLNVVTHRQLVWLLQQEGNSLIFFGGAWCANTQAAIATVNDYAIANGDTVYFYDPAWESYFANYVWEYNKSSDPRYGGQYPTGPEFVPYYAALITDYLTNVTVSENPLYHFDYTDESGTTYSIGSMQVPYLLSYNKDAVDSDGFAAPITAFVEDAIYHLEVGADDYIYSADNYATYKAEVKAVFEAYAAATRTIAQDTAIDRSAN